MRSVRPENRTVRHPWDVVMQSHVPAPQEGEARVLVTFLPRTGPVDLRERGIDEANAADLRGRLRAFAEDWDRPEMDVYDEM